MADLEAPGAIGPNEYTILDKLDPSLGNPRANWYRNAGVLRDQVSNGLTQVRDASPTNFDGQFLNAERNLLNNLGWLYDEPSSIYYAP
jgi:hypothetical protein